MQSAPLLHVLHPSDRNADQREAALRELLARVRFAPDVLVRFERSTEVVESHLRWGDGDTLLLPERDLWQDDTGWMKEGARFLEIVQQHDDVGEIAEALLDGASSPPWLGIDLPAVCAGILSGREEDSNANRDVHGRFSASESMLHRAGVLHRPVVDEAARALGLLLLRHLGVPLDAAPAFHVALTFDVDSSGIVGAGNALRFARRVWREAGPSAGLRALALGAAATIGARPDPHLPFDRMMDELEDRDAAAAFFVQALQEHALDDYALAGEPRLIRACRILSERGHEVGLHGSYATSDRDASFVRRQRKALHRSVGVRTSSHRAHYLRHRGEGTDRLLREGGVRVDCSCGFSDREGFRRGTAYPVFPGDRRAPVSVPLHLMDVTLRYHRALSPGEALERGTEIVERAARTGGCAVVLWHPHNMEPLLWRGWERMPFELLDAALERGGRAVTPTEYARAEAARRRALFNPR